MNPKTKFLICLTPVSDNKTTIKYLGHRFKWDIKRNPIPVEVPEDVAVFLLEMVDSSCRCHWRPPKAMFKEVPNPNINS